MFLLKLQKSYRKSYLHLKKTLTGGPHLAQEIIMLICGYKNINFGGSVAGWLSEQLNYDALLS